MNNGRQFGELSSSQYNIIDSDKYSNVIKAMVKVIKNSKRYINQSDLTITYDRIIVDVRDINDSIETDSGMSEGLADLLIMEFERRLKGVEFTKNNNYGKFVIVPIVLKKVTDS